MIYRTIRTYTPHPSESALLAACRNRGIDPQSIPGGRETTPRRLNHLRVLIGGKS